MEDSLNECSWWKLGRRLEELWVCYDHYKSSSFDNKVHVRVRGKHLIKKIVLMILTFVFDVLFSITYCSKLCF